MENEVERLRKARRGGEEVREEKRDGEKRSQQ